MLTTGIEGTCDRCGEESDDLWMGNCSPCNDAKGMEETSNYCIDCGRIYYNCLCYHDDL